MSQFPDLVRYAAMEALMQAECRETWEKKRLWKLVAREKNRDRILNYCLMAVTA